MEERLLGATMTTAVGAALVGLAVGLIADYETPYWAVIVAAVALFVAIKLI